MNFIRLGFDCRGRLQLKSHFTELAFSIYVLKNAKVKRVQLGFFHRWYEGWCCLIVNELNKFWHNILQIYLSSQTTFQILLNIQVGLE